MPCTQLCLAHTRRLKRIWGLVVPPLISEPVGVLLPEGLSAHLHSLAGRAAPYEACGLLLGTFEALEAEVGTGESTGASAGAAGKLSASSKDSRQHACSVCVRYFAPSKNIASQPERYFEIDPHLQIALQRRTRGHALQVVGVWHSHPSGLACPSEQDQRDAQATPFLWLITGRAASPAETVQINVNTDLQTNAFWCGAKGLSRTPLQVAAYRADTHFLTV